MSEAEKAVDELLEADKPIKLTKPFPAKAVISPKSIASHGTTLTSRGAPWMIKLYAENAPIPEEMFKGMDIHNEAEGEGFIGWIGGTFGAGGTRPDPKTGEEKEFFSSLLVEEAQSDLLQRSVEFTDPVQYQKTLRQKLVQNSEEYARASKELEALKKEFAGSKALDPLQRRLGYEERINELEVEMEEHFEKWKREFKHPSFSKFKSKLENYYHKWTDAMFNAALQYAKQREAVFLAILTADKIKSIWHSNLKDKDRSLFDRIYDRTAERWDMKRHGDWWVGHTAQMQPLESASEVIADLLGEELPDED